MANPTSQVPVDSKRFDEDKVYWPLSTANTSDVIYGGEMMGMVMSTGYANHMDDSVPMLFLGIKQGITHRIQSDTPSPTDFKELIRRPKAFEIPLGGASTYASIPVSIGLPAFAVDSGHVQIGTTSGLTNANYVGKVVDIGRSGSTGGGTGGITSLTGPSTAGSTTVVIGPDVSPGIGNLGAGPAAFGTTQTITANSSTITVPAASIAKFVTATAAFTGIILGAGRYDGDTLRIINTTTTSGANLTFAAAATSNVANGTGASVSVSSSSAYIWSSVNKLWY